MGPITGWDPGTVSDVNDIAHISDGALKFIHHFFWGTIANPKVNGNPVYVGKFGVVWHTKTIPFRLGIQPLNVSHVGLSYGVMTPK